MFLWINKKKCQYSVLFDYYISALSGAYVYFFAFCLKKKRRLSEGIDLGNQTKLAKLSKGIDLGNKTEFAGLFTKIYDENNSDIRGGSVEPTALLSEYIAEYDVALLEAAQEDTCHELP